MNKRTGVYLAALLLLLIVAAYFVWNGKRIPHVPADQAFAVQDTAAVEKVIITDTRGDKAVLERNDHYWKLNDTSIAMQVKINFLLKTLTQLRMEYPVNVKDVDRIKTDILKKNVKIEIFSGRFSGPHKVMYIGRVLNSALGNYAVMELDGKPADKPYIINIPNFVGDVQAMFFTKAIDWRDLTVFNRNMDDIKRVTVLYPYHPLSSFRLTVMGKDSSMLEHQSNGNDAIPADDKKLEDEWNSKPKTLNKVKVNDFLNSFTFINAEAYDNDYYGKDTILDKKPLAKVYLETKKGETDSITIYLMPANQRTKTQLASGEIPPYDLDRYYAVIHGRKDFVVIQQFVFGKILRRYDDFFTLTKG